MELTTKRLTLRPIGPQDAESAHRYAGDPAITKYMIFLPADSLEETKRDVRRASDEWKKDFPAFYEFAVLLKGRHIGGVSVYLNQARTEGELGWIFLKETWGKGYATEAAVAVMEFAVKTLGVKRIVAHCDAENAASARVMEKLGLTLEDGTGLRINRSAKPQSRELLFSFTVE